LTIAIAESVLQPQAIRLHVATADAAVAADDVVNFRPNTNQMKLMPICIFVLVESWPSSTSFWLKTDCRNVCSGQLIKSRRLAVNSTQVAQLQILWQGAVANNLSHYLLSLCLSTTIGK